ncbi:MAG: topoisomerase DNA-binding C4 zinc finger domain-containing protein [Actinobacteria bacterium]|nr:topoisomerase DNA-binding C4 zinc finger domain-containing protein [Actinomycetota bacterium]MCL5887665.1 topoisomerase DNA-binding C4 zinc finger domain-containing protein [Actinomycetota bacterium]MCL5887668.1 topoisomerase DNA-binding C4 zinc finger domain-containing protein [Actinomycetota bacterium]
MVLRTAKRGAQQGNRFYGCANYPSCRQTRSA